MVCVVRRDGPSDDDGDHGAVLVEFALVITYLMMVLLLIVQVGEIYSAQVSIQGAAREGARALALRQNAYDAVMQAAGSADVTDVQEIRKCAGLGPYGPLEYAEVKVTATYPVLGIPLVPDDLFGERKVTAKASMRCGL